MSNDIPLASIKNQPLTTRPIPLDTTLVDDPVMLVDGTALTGSPVTIIDSLPTDVKPPVYRPTIKISR